MECFCLQFCELYTHHVPTHHVLTFYLTISSKQRTTYTIMATKRKLTTKSYDEKYAIIKFMDENPSMRKKDVATRFDVKPSTLSDIIKNREKIVKAVEKPLDARKGTIKRVKGVTFDDVDAALRLWLQQKDSSADLHIDIEMLISKAKDFAHKLGHDTFPNISWVHRFKNRHGIGQIQKAGEAGGVNEELVSEWKERKLQDVFNRYEARDIYNADETVLFWQMLPEKSLGFLGHSYHRSKQPKTWITVLVCANMDGSDKLPFLVIGKSKNPGRAFQNVQHLPVEYEANKKACMTAELFESWLRKLDGSMGRQNRKIAMIVDNCPAHPNLDLDNIELVFLPPNTTRVTQPMQGGIIRALKQHYRHILASRRLAAAEDGETFSWNLLDAIISIKSAWGKSD